MILRASITVCLFVSGVVAEPTAVHAQVRPPRPTAQQRQQVTRLLNEFRRARNDPAGRARVIAEALTVGQPAVAPLQMGLRRELDPRLKRYREQFQRQAVAVYRRRLGQTDPAEVARLRAVVLGLQQAPDFSKEAIIARADPAMARLAEIFLIDRKSILATSEMLQRERAELVGMGQLWQQCTDFLAGERRDSAAAYSQSLQAEEKMAVATAAPISGPARQVLLNNARLASQLDPEESQGIAQLNVMRSLLGLRPMAIDLRLCAAARDHSRDMQTQNFFSHLSPIPGKQTASDRARRQGTTADAENIYHGTTSSRTATDGWFHSPGHHKNMLGSRTRVGLGRSGTYFTQMFGK